MRDFYVSWNVELFDEADSPRGAAELSREMLLVRHPDVLITVTTEDGTQHSIDLSDPTGSSDRIVEAERGYDVSHKPLDLTPAQLRRVADILESNSDQRGFDMWSALAAMETADDDPAKLTIDEVIDQADAMGLLDEVPDYIWPDPNGEGWIDAWNGWYDTLERALEEASGGSGRPWILNRGEGLLDEDGCEQRRAIRKLLTDWFDAALFRISEVGQSQDWPPLVEDAKARHATFGVPWHNSFVPGYVREILALSDN